MIPGVAIHPEGQCQYQYYRTLYHTLPHIYASPTEQYNFSNVENSFPCTRPYRTPLLPPPHPTHFSLPKPSHRKHPLLRSTPPYKLPLQIFSLSLLLLHPQSSSALLSHLLNLSTTSQPFSPPPSPHAHPIMPTAPPIVTLRPARLARLAIFLSALSITIALLLTHYLPNRFRIHPLPYLSDAGLRDPERIFITLGLALSATLFLPLAAAAHLRFATLLPSRSSHLFIPLPFHLPSIPLALIRHLAPRAAIMLTTFLASFTAIPGWFFLHHLFALFFAMSAAVWSLCIATQAHLLCNTPTFSRRLYMLTAMQALVISSFATVWISVKLRYPFRLIPNKDPRFVILALLEYLGTTSFLATLALVASFVHPATLELRLGASPKSTSHIPPIV